MDASHLRLAAAQARARLDAIPDDDWTRPVPDLDFTVASVVAHTGDGLIWYAFDLIAGPSELDATQVGVKPDTPPSELRRAVSTYAELLARAVEGSSDDERGWHPTGLVDASGFAAMACDELLVHVSDAARGVGQTFTPAAHLATAVLNRLFPWISLDDLPTDDPWTALLWANGRIDLPGLPRRRHWQWHCAPLADWDGKTPDAYL